MSRLVSVAVPVPLLPPLTYSVPDRLSLPERGSRVLVPLGNRVVTGCVIAHNHHETRLTSESKVKDIVDCLDTGALVPHAIVDLALWVAEYYACGPGEALAAAMPPQALSHPVHGKVPGFKTVPVAHVTARGREVSGGTIGRRLGERQREALLLLAGSPIGLDTAVLARRGVGGDTLRRLERRGLISIGSRRVERGPFLGHGAVTSDQAGGESAALELTPEQRLAVGTLTRLADTRRFHVALLHGVTGSGKTEVYLRLAMAVCAGGRRVLALVPEIGLTSAVAATFRRVFGNRVAIQHSGLSDGERHDQWQRMRRGEVDVAVGTRSAVFAPLDKLGLIVVDEEHDASYKQEESPRYHGRDVAVMRGQRAKALVVLGSATPSMESFHNARTGRYERVIMRQRVFDRPLASVRIVNMREEVATEGPEVVLSADLRNALMATLARRQQALILLNRRGFATAVFCRACGRTLECPNCSVSLTLHRAAERARCHYCNYTMAHPRACLHCAGPYLEAVGFGTERIETEIAERFPTASVARLDRDTVRRRGAVQTLLATFANGDIDVLVGTQMIAKGHDFPKVTLVGVISADVGLGLADFRAAERTFQLLTQVAGRAGRGDQRGEAIIQSFYPEHYSVSYACRQDYEPFFDEEIRFRRGMHYPPIVSMVNVVVRGRTFNDAMAGAAELAGLVRAECGFRVLGPAAAPIARLRGQHRAQVFLKGHQRQLMRKALQAALDARPELKRRVIIDVDPLTVL